MAGGATTSIHRRLSHLCSERHLEPGGPAITPSSNGEEEARKYRLFGQKGGGMLVRGELMEKEDDEDQTWPLSDQ